MAQPRSNQQRQPQQPRAAAQQAPAANDSARLEEVSLAVQSAIAECGFQSISHLPAFTQAIRMAQGVRELRAALTDEFVASTLMPLRGTALGFLTDKDRDDPSYYGIAIVRDCAIEAMLRGFNVVGNEFNIISGRFYGTKAGFERLVAEWPGLTDLVLQPGVPVMSASDKTIAAVPYTAEWRVAGKPMAIICQKVEGALDTRIPVKVNGGMGPDAIIGKATRKMLFRIYQRLNGSSLGLVDGDVNDVLTTGEPAPTNALPAGQKPKQGAALDAMVERHEQTKRGSVPPPAPAEQAEPALEVAVVHAQLRAADKAWTAADLATLIETWSPERRRQAYAWAIAFNDNSIQDDALPERPLFTVLEPAQRQPGEEG
jgi:hypothetical protein